MACVVVNVPFSQRILHNFPTLKNLALMAMCTFNSSTSQTLDETQNYRSKWWGTCLSQRYFTILPNFEEFSLDGYVHI
jgi:hypothetical protein